MRPPHKTATRELAAPAVFGLCRVAPPARVRKASEAPPAGWLQGATDGRCGCASCRTARCLAGWRAEPCVRTHEPPSRRPRVAPMARGARRPAQSPTPVALGPRGTNFHGTRCVRRAAPWLLPGRAATIHQASHTAPR
eukprot:scaffold1589_cov111-Isochrysis_galbana.AAC.5